MENKKKEDVENPMAMLAAFTQMMGSPGFGNFFGGLPFEEKEKYPHQRLGNRYELRQIEIKDAKGNIIENRERYSHLYHNELKVSSEVFRKGGTGGEFKDGYCSLIHYVPQKNTKHKADSGKNIFDFGTHVIINELGDIKMKNSGLSYPSHIGGHLASLDNYIYDLRTGKAILPKSSTSITGANCVIVDHRYSWYNKAAEMPLGIYKVDFWTAEITKIDEVK